MHRDGRRKLEDDTYARPALPALPNKTVERLMISEQPTRIAPLEEQDLERSLQQALQATIFTSNLRVSPRRVNQIAREVATAFRQFLAAQDCAAPIFAYGQRLAGEGIGHKAILALVETLHCVAWERADLGSARLPASVPCGSHLLAGYMAGREAYLLQEQERTRIALERARAQAQFETMQFT
jgi:hypothetical protein